MGDGLGEKALAPGPDPVGLVAIVEHDGGRQGREVVVDHARYQPRPVSALDRRQVEIVVVPHLVHAGEPEHERPNAVFSGQAHRVPLAAGDEQRWVGSLHGPWQDRVGSDLQLAIPGNSSSSHMRLIIRSDSSTSR